MVEAIPRSVALALGSNMGDRLDHLRAAVRAAAEYVHITAISSVYETAAAYVTDQPSFLNAALLGTTVIEPLALLWSLKAAESAIGRQPTFRYGPRVIDIDILFYGETVLSSPELTIPHPRMAERDFVLRPLCDIASSWQHPQKQQNVEEMLSLLPDKGMTCLGQIL